MTMVVEALSNKAEEKPTVKAASDSLLKLCRGLKRSKFVGIIALDAERPDYVPSLPKPPLKIVLMNSARGSSAPDYKPVYEEPKPQEHCEIVCEREKELGEKRNVEKDMSKRDNREIENDEIENDEKVFGILNDVNILNDVEKGIFCGPENYERGKDEAAHDVGGGLEPEKDEKGDDSDADSWADTRVKRWLRQRVKTRRMNASLPASFWRQGQGSAWASLKPKNVSSDSSSYSRLTCRSCRFSAISGLAIIDPLSSPRATPGSPRSGGSPRTASPSPRAAPGSPRASSASSTYTPTSDDDAEPLGLDKGEEFILVKVSQAKGKCWATFLNDNPKHSSDGLGHFALGTSIEEMLERRRKHHEKLNATTRKQDLRSMSPYREDGFTMFTNPSVFAQLNDREQGEKPSPGLRQAAKSIAPAAQTNAAETDTWDPNGEGRIESWGTGRYHHTEEFRAEEKAIADSWSQKRMRSDRLDRDEMMRRGSSPPSKKRAASKTLLDDIDDPRGEVWNSMTPKERRRETDFNLNVENPVGYRTRQIEVIQTYLWDEDGKMDLKSSATGESVALKVTWEPVNGSDEMLITKEIRLNPNQVHEDGIT
jgi:hypothetical protein